MKTRTSSLMDSHLVDFSNKNAHLIKSNSTTSSQTEISDEEIQKEAEKYAEKGIEINIPYGNGLFYGFKAGVKWYREQLKQRQ